MSRKKLVAIIVPCVIAIIVVIVITTHLPQNTRKPEQIAVSAYNFSEQLFDPQLTSLQRDTLWKEYEGKQVKWISELKEVVSGKEGTVAYFLNPLDWDRTEIKAVFDESQSSNLSQCKKGDLVTYTGILSSFAEAEISLTDCTFVSPSVVPLWWNHDIDTHSKRILVGEGVLCLGFSTYADITPSIIAINRGTGGLLWELNRTYSALVGIDSRYVYANVSGQGIDWPAGFDWMQDWFTIIAVDKISGQVANGTTNQTESGLIHLKDRPPLSELTYEYEGVIYRGTCAVYEGAGTNCGTLQAIDQVTGSVLWMMTFEETGMTDFSIDNGILYVSTDNGIGAFKLPNATDLQNSNG